MDATRRTLLAGAMAGLLPAASARAAMTPLRLRLRLLGTSDLHMFARAWDYWRDRPDPAVGLTRVATLIRQARAETPNTLLFDNGDIIQGNPLGDYMVEQAKPAPDAVHPMLRAMNALGYDAATLGNHEFNYGLDFLDRTIAGAAFPFACANLDHADGRSYLPRTLVLTRPFQAEDGSAVSLRIGVIGFVPPPIMVWDRSKLEGRVAVRDIVEAAQAEIPALRRRCDLVIALSHSGIATAPRTGSDENASFHLAGVAGIDAIFTGHSHRVFPGPDYAHRHDVDAAAGRLRGVPAVMPGFWGSHLGVIDLDLRRDGAGDWTVERGEAQARPILREHDHRQTPTVDDDPAVNAAVEPEHRATVAWVKQPAGRLGRPVSSFFALAGDDSVVAMINAAQLWYARPLLAGTPHAHVPLLSAASPFKAGGFSPQNYIDLPAGPVAIKDVAELYPYPNTLCAVRITGAVLREWLERAAGLFEQVSPRQKGPQPLLDGRSPSYNFDVIAGVTYRIDLLSPPRYSSNGVLEEPDLRRIVDLRFDGAPIDPAAEFVIVTNNYRADGGGHFPGLQGGDRVVLRAPDTNREALLGWVRQGGEIAPSSRVTWAFADLPAGVELAFDSAPAAERLLAEHRGIRKLGVGRNGFARFILDPNAG